MATSNVLPDKQSENETLSMNTTEPDQMVYPADIFVRIGSMSDAATFWVTQVTSDNSKEIKTPLGHVMSLESHLRKLYNVQSSENKMFLFDEKRDEIKKEMMVAVRRSPRSPHWFRGIVVKVAEFQDGYRASVFLVDYGDYVDNAWVHNSIRKLPSEYAHTIKPLAFRLKLSDVVPIEMDLNYNMGMKAMTPVIATKWEPSAVSYIANLLIASKTRFARVFDWTHDKALNIIFGGVQLLGFKQKVVLQDILIRKRFGIKMLKRSMTTNNDDVQAIRPRFTSMVPDDDDDEDDESFDYPEPLVASTMQRSQSDQKDLITNLKGPKENDMLLIPAGIDIGKDIEKRLSQIPDDDELGIGPKQLSPSKLQAESGLDKMQNEISRRFLSADDVDYLSGMRSDKNNSFAASSDFYSVGSPCRDASGGHRKASVDLSLNASLDFHSVGSPCRGASSGGSRQAASTLSYRSAELPGFGSGRCGMRATSSIATLEGDSDNWSFKDVIETLSDVGSDRASTVVGSSIASGKNNRMPAGDGKDPIKTGSTSGTEQQSLSRSGNLARQAPGEESPSGDEKSKGRGTKYRLFLQSQQK